jgi:hypothetical protein
MIVGGTIPSKPTGHVSYRLISFVQNYPHKQSDFLARDKDGCPIFSVDDGFRILKVCEDGQALFAIDRHSVDRAP